LVAEKKSSSETVGDNYEFRVSSCGFVGRSCSFGKPKTIHETTLINTNKTLLTEGNSDFRGKPPILQFE